jgi:carbonic anhydrase
MKNPFHNIRPNLAGDQPEIHPSALIDPSAQIIGKVVIGRNVFVAPLAVIRADERGPDGAVAPILLEEEVNIGDGVIIHSQGGELVTIGQRTSVGHGVTIHGPCTIEADCFLAMRCTVFNAVLETGVWVGMSSIVTRTRIETHTYVPGGSLIRSVEDAQDLRLVSAKEKQYMQKVLDAASRLREDYLKLRLGSVGK